VYERRGSVNVITQQTDLDLTHEQHLETEIAELRLVYVLWLLEGSHLTFHFADPPFESLRLTLELLEAMSSNSKKSVKQTSPL
jgi:hypothetical protein